MAELRDEQETILKRLVQHSRQEEEDTAAEPSSPTPGVDEPDPVQSSEARWLQFYSSWVDEDAAVCARVACDPLKSNR
jgi:hypothetical protein